MRKRIRGWAAMRAAIVLVAAVILVDSMLTGPLGRTAPRAFVPDSAQWIATAADFPAFCKRLLETDLVKAVNHEAPDYYAAFQLALRKQTGIRPTPLRWRVWLGRPFVAAVSEEGWGACVRPGLLLRVVDTLAGLGGWRPTVRKFGPWYYGWRDRALVFSKSEEYVLASLESQMNLGFHSIINPPDRFKLGVMSSTGDGSVSVMPTKGQLLVSGWTRRPEDVSMGSDGVVQPLAPDAAIAWAAAPKPEDLQGLARLFWNQLDNYVQLSANPAFATFKQLSTDILAPWYASPLPDNWDEHVAACLIALLDVDTSETLPVPELGLVLRSDGTASKNGTPWPHPLQPLIASTPALPYEWEGQAGLLAPCAGEKAALCLTASGMNWLAASQEPAMTDLISALQQPGIQCGVGQTRAVVAINWSKAAAAAQTIANKAANLELLPRKNNSDLQKSLVPLLRALAIQGNAHLHLWTNNERIEFQGALTGGACQ